MMKLIVNGREHEHGGPGTLPALLEELGVGRARVAVMVNERVARWEERETVRLSEGDRIDVFRMIGGG